MEAQDVTKTETQKVTHRPLFEREPIYSMWLRELIRFSGMQSRILATFASPLIWLLFLGIPLSQIFSSGASQSIVTGGLPFFAFIVPGIVCMGLLFGGTNSGVTVLWDKEFGFLKEVMVAPVRRTSLMIGRSLGALTIAIIQALATIGIALILGTWFGFRIISVAGFLLAMGFAIITFFAFVGFGLTLGAMIENTEGFTTIIRMIEFPMFFLSGALLPLTVIKGIPVLYQLQFINPLTYGVDGVRGSLPVYSTFRHGLI